MKVYLVFYILAVGDECLERAFSTKESAEAWVATKHDPCNYPIYEVEVHP